MMASRSGDDDAGCSSPGISYELRARDLPSKRLLGKGLASIAYETELNGERFARKDFIGVPSGSFQKEASILVGLEDHKNVVKTHGWTVDKLSCSLLLEYVEEDLLDLLKKRKESQKRPASIASGSQSERILFQKGKESLKRPAGITFGRQSERSHTNPFAADPLPFLPFAASADDPFAAGLAFGRRLKRDHTYPFELAEALDIVEQIARGMEFLHAHHISHGDLKTKNILVTHTNDGDKKLLTVKVADFGLVRTESKSMSFVSRQARKFDMVQWQAPEILEGLLSEDNEETSSESDSDPEKDCAGPLRVIDGYAADVYSFAVTCSQILTGEDPYPIQNWIELGLEIVVGELRPNFPTGFPPLLKQLLELCWRKVPAEQPTFSSIFELLDLLQDPAMMDLMERQLLSEVWPKALELHRTPKEKRLQVLLEVNPREKPKPLYRRHRAFKNWIIAIRPRKFKKCLWFGTYKTLEEVDRAVDAVNYYMGLNRPYKYRDSRLIFAAKKLKGIQFRDLESSCEQFIQVGDRRINASSYFAWQVREAIWSVVRQHKEPVSFKSYRSSLPLLETKRVLTSSPQLETTSSTSHAKISLSGIEKQIYHANPFAKKLRQPLRSELKSRDSFGGEEDFVDEEDIIELSVCEVDLTHSSD